jgi:DNA-directed RNA polymerase specialized sigma24 family protein/anti-sigma-K factor RskA
MSANLAALDSALQRCARKETSGLEQVYRQIAPSIKALARHVLNDEALAQQVLHDSMIMVWQHANHFNPVYGCANAWIFSIFRYRLQALQRQAATNQTLRIASAKNWLTQFSPCLEHFEPPLAANLNEETARVIVLAYCKGLSSADIALVLNINANIMLADLTHALTNTMLESQSGTENDTAQIALYVLGLLGSDPLVSTQSKIAENDDALKQALYWEATFFRLAQALPTQAPDEQTWEKVQKTLNLTIIPQPLRTPEKPSQTQRSAAASTGTRTAQQPAVNGAATTPRPSPESTKTSPGKGRKWRVLVAAVLVLLMTGALLYIWLTPIQPELAAHNSTAENTDTKPPEPLSLHAVVLQPPGSTSTPGWLIVSREPGVLHLEPLLKSQLAENETLVLWRRKPNSPTIQKLGTINDTSPAQIRLANDFSIVEPMLYEITIERIPAELGEPQGDIAFIGQSFRLKVPDPEPEAPAIPAQ